MTLAVPSPTLVTSVTRVTPGQPSWLPTLPTPWARDDRGQLRCGVRRSGPDSFAAEHHVLVQQVREPGLFGQFHDRDQSGAGHQILVIEHGRAVTPGMPQFHRKCPSDPRRLGLQQTYCRRSKGTFVISTQSVATLVHGFRLSGQVPLASKAVEALASDHFEAAQALAVVVTETAVAQSISGKYEVVKKQVLFDPQLVPYGLLRLNAALAPIGRFYTIWWAGSGDPKPQELSRHVSVHHADAGHYTEANAVIAVMLVTSVLRALQELQEVAAASKEDAA